MADLAKDLIKKLKSSDGEYLPAIYLEALKVSYLRCKAEGDDEDAINGGEEGQKEGQQQDDETGLKESMREFVALSHRVAQSQAAFNAPASTLAYLAEHGATWALEDPVERLEFLHGMSYFMIRVKGAAAAEALAAVEAAGARAGAPPPLEDDDEETDVGDWVLYHEYCAALRAQAAAAPATAVKRAAVVGSGGGAARKGDRKGAKGKRGAGGRKISFAEDVEEQPSTSTRRKTQQAQRTQRAQQRAANAEVGNGQDTLDQGDGEDGDDVNVDVMPTDERLPGMESDQGARKSRRRR